MKMLTVKTDGVEQKLRNIPSYIMKGNSHTALLNAVDNHASISPLRLHFHLSS